MPEPNTTELLIANVHDVLARLAREMQELKERIAAPNTMHAGSSSVIRSDEAELPVFRPLAEELRELEIHRIKQALRITRGHQDGAAMLLGIPRRTFTFKIKKYGLRQYGLTPKVPASPHLTTPGQASTTASSAQPLQSSPPSSPEGEFAAQPQVTSLNAIANEPFFGRRTSGECD